MNFSAKIYRKKFLKRGSPPLFLLTAICLWYYVYLQVNGTFDADAERKENITWNNREYCRL